MPFTRRDFTRLTAFGAASQMVGPFAPSLLAQPDHKTGYCIVGLGRIADHFLAALPSTPNSRATALVSGHRDKAERIAERYNIPKSSIYNYENMDSIRDNPAIDAVYVALPNSMHAEYTIRSAKAGKHVLCEKPMSTTVPEAQAMIDACKAANVKLMIAYRCHYEPTNLKAVQLIRDGALGQVQSIESAFGFNCGPREWRLNKQLSGGGPLFDVGIYCLNATRYLTGEEPAQISAFASSDKSDPRFRDIEETLTWITRFPSGVLATCSTTYGGNMEGHYRVQGSKGWLEVTSAFSYEGLRLRASYANPNGPETRLDELNPDRDPIHFVREASHFSECIQQNRIPKSPGEEGLRDMQYIREIYRTAGITMA